MDIADIPHIQAAVALLLAVEAHSSRNWVTFLLQLAPVPHQPLLALSSSIAGRLFDSQVVSSLHLDLAELRRYVSERNLRLPWLILTCNL